MTKNQLVKAERLPRVAYQGAHVITTELLAAVYGTDPQNIRKNFNNNLSRFVEGKHFHKVVGKGLQDLRITFGDAQISSKARSVILWTERGAARHAKMLETDQAWDVFEALEDSYFNKRDRIAKMKDRAPLHHDAIDIASNSNIPLPKVYGTLNRWIGVKRISAMTVQQVAETLGFSGRWKANGQTNMDIQRIEANSIALYGESPQLSLTGMGVLA